METTNYVTVWSRSLYVNVWVIERTHSIDYVKSMYCLSIGEVADIKGRYYGVFPENYNPNLGHQFNF